MKHLSLVASLIAIAALSGFIAAPRVHSQQPAVNATTAKVVAAANNFLNTLSTGERAKASFSFDSSQKTNWSNLPSGIYQRNSLRLGDLSAAQRTAALSLLSAALSPDGYRKV